MLSEDILLRCNFIKNGNAFESDAFGLLLNDDILFYVSKDNNRKPIKYLHELQKLYCDLTGKELDIDLCVKK